MANKELKDLTASSGAAGTDLVVTQNASNQTRKTTLAQAWAWMAAQVGGLTNGTAADDDKFLVNTAAGLARYLTLSQISTQVISTLLAAARTFASNLGVGGTLSVTGAATFTDDVTVNGGDITLNNATSNRVTFRDTGAAAPTFTTRSTGARVILWPLINATNADHAIGVESGFTWFSVPTTSAGYKFYGGTTEYGRWTNTGLGVGATPACKVDANGTIRATGSTTPASGTGGEILWNGSATQIISINRTTPAYQPLHLDGSTVLLKTSNTTRVTLQSSGGVLFSTPPILPSYTLATVPTASSFQWGQIVITDLAGGAEPCFSDGAAWRVGSTRAVAA